MSKSKAAAKKKMFLNNIKNKVKTSNKGSYMDRDYDYEDSDGSISSDDVDVLEEEYLGNIIKEQYIIIKYMGRYILIVTKILNPGASTGAMRGSFSAWHLGKH